MLSFLTKKKITEEKFAEIVVNHTISVVSEAFPYMAQLLNDDPDLVKSPQIKDYDYDKFLLIVISGNLLCVPKHFHDYQDVRLSLLLHKKLSEKLEVSEESLKKAVADCQSYMTKVNLPSKNILYAMAKAVFFQYHLNDCQEDYFRKMQTPNPLILKRMNEMMQNFLWDWDLYREKYKIAEI
jgi:hypothetical protein